MSTSNNSSTDAALRTRSWLKWLIFGIVGIVTLGLVTYQMATYEPKPKPVAAQSLSQQTTTIPLASSPQSSWPKLVIPAKGKSELIPVPVDMHILMAGNKFLNHNVYVDGHECVFGEPCVSGPLAGNYATNEAQETNIISYAFAPN